ncbi:2-C-methyl-D-erythritol 2,4-cyclodiphosphate synthase [Candidatus Spongiihabitans sp.]|uniref:2-C-methyl-D-erythritol 2,4-cyclodiphosphate synthase n=1 Tax=Candidatus Spongiihabitans sp. TaxID=3101308 RepID=UPI003C6EDD29
MRIGNGYDIHALVKGRKLILGGVEIDWHLGLAGHSDADVLLHAICDACLGAAAMGDIGHHFPPDDDQYKDLDSRILLRNVAAMLRHAQWKIGNLDCTIIAEKPRLSPYISAMRENISSDLSIALSQINIKATTAEGLGFIGQQQGIAAQAVVLLETADSPAR